MAQFKSLNKSFNTSNEEVIKSRAHLNAVNNAIATGKMVVPDGDKRGMRVLELRLQELKEQLADFDRKYTRSYLALNPNLNLLPGKIKALEKEIQSKRHYGQSIVLSEAEQNHEVAVSISSINMYNDTATGLMNNLQQVIDPLTQDRTQPLQHYEHIPIKHDALKELSVDTINTLLNASDIKAKQLISMLLSGLNLEEISQIENKQFDFSNDLLNITGSNQRTIPLNPVLKSLFENTEPCPAWSKSQPVTIETLKAILAYATADAGFTHAHEISSELICTSYILYLVKQGLRFSELESIIGYIEPTELSKFTGYSPAKKGLSVTEINRVHPSLMI